MSTATPILVPIQGTFSIAQARSTLRTQITQWSWPNTLNAHATTALTALGELILALGKPQPIQIRMALIEHAGHQGIELSAQFHVTDQQNPRWRERIQNLERASTEVQFHQLGDHVSVAAFIWV